MWNNKNRVFDFHDSQVNKNTSNLLNETEEIAQTAIGHIIYFFIFYQRKMPTGYEEETESEIKEDSKLGEEQKSNMEMNFQWI